MTVFFVIFLIMCPIVKYQCLVFDYASSRVCVPEWLAVVGCVCVTVDPRHCVRPGQLPEQEVGPNARGGEPSPPPVRVLGLVGGLVQVPTAGPHTVFTAPPPPPSIPIHVSHYVYMHTLIKQILNRVTAIIQIIISCTFCLIKRFDSLPEHKVIKMPG